MVKTVVSNAQQLGFDAVWQRVSTRHGTPDPALRPLLHGVYSALLAQPSDPMRLVAAAKSLLKFLSGPGRTEANTWFVDLFLNQDEGWQAEWAAFPDPLHDVIADMAGALHDTVTSPEVARNFSSTPEQLLARLQELEERGHNRS